MLKHKKVFLLVCPVIVATALIISITCYIFSHSGTEYELGKFFVEFGWAELPEVHRRMFY